MNIRNSKTPLSVVPLPRHLPLNSAFSSAENLFHHKYQPTPKATPTGIPTINNSHNVRNMKNSQIHAKVHSPMVAVPIAPIGEVSMNQKRTRSAPMIATTQPIIKTVNTFQCSSIFRFQNSPSLQLLFSSIFSPFFESSTRRRLHNPEIYLWIISIKDVSSKHWFNSKLLTSIFGVGTKRIGCKDNSKGNVLIPRKFFAKNILSKKLVRLIVLVGWVGFEPPTHILRTEG